MKSQTTKRGRDRERPRAATKKRTQTKDCNKILIIMNINVILLVSALLLHFDGASLNPDYIYRYHEAGQDAKLPCVKLAHSGPTCANVTWLYYKHGSSILEVVRKGEIVQDGARDCSRLSLNTDCSLTVHNVTEEDTGAYVCGLPVISDSDRFVYLSVLRVSPAPPNLDVNQNRSVTLQCALWRYSELDACGDGRFHWLNKNKKVLSRAGIAQNKCVSYLTVERQSQHNRTYTCQYVVGTLVMGSADYTLPGNSESGSVYIVPGAVVSVLVLLVVAAVVVFKIKSKRKTTETMDNTEGDPQASSSLVDPENSVTYAMINHRRGAAKNQAVEEETVTYSAVNIKTSDLNNSAIYSTVNKTA